MKNSFRRLALALATAILAGCSAQPDLTGPADPAPNHLLGGATGLLGGTVQGIQGVLLTCRPLPRQSASAVIGTAGGTIQVGPHSLRIPRGALARSTRITAEILSDGVSSVKFGPEGLQFAKPAELALSYSHCYGPGLLLPKRIAYTTDLLAILEILRSSDDLRARVVKAPLDHFSRYAVAY